MKENNTQVQTKTQVRTATAVTIGLLFGIGISSAAAGLIQFNKLQQQKPVDVIESMAKQETEESGLLDEESCHPDAVEICDGIDNNCDGLVDESGAIGEITWYIDSDADTWGNDTDTILSCAQPDNAVARGFDCDDTDVEITIECGAIPRDEE